MFNLLTEVEPPATPLSLFFDFRLFLPIAYEIVVFKTTSSRPTYPRFFYDAGTEFRVVNVSSHKS